MNFYLKTTSSFVALLAFTAITAQETTKEGYTRTWTNTIVVVPADSISNDDHKFGAVKFTVFESDGGDAIDLWKIEMKGKCKSVGGSNPTKAIGCMVPSISTFPIQIMAMATTDKKADLGQVALAYGLNDSVPVPDSLIVIQHIRAVAVAVNKATVQKQIDDYSKTLDKATGKLEGAQKDIAKNDKSLEKSNKALAKAKTAIAKITAQNAKLKSQVTGLEGKFGSTNDPKDLKDLTKARGKLASSEGNLAKELKNEAKATEAIGKYQGKSPDQAKEEAERASTQEENEKIVNDLKKKLEAIK